MAQVIADIVKMREIVRTRRDARTKIAAVPTMGALHEGHLHLIREARRAADVVVTTVFVNPVQFGKGEDFERYPRNLEADVKRADLAGSAYVFAPSAADMYPPGFSTFVDVEGVTGVLEGRFRPGHFRGVATVVVKLLNIIRPDVAFFGQKDAQQVVVIRRLLRDLDFDVELVVVPTVREADGLALSSRNVHLSAAERAEAPVLYRALRCAEEMILKGETNCSRITEAMSSMIRGKSSAVIDYLSVADAATLEEQRTIGPGQRLLVSLAARFGATRLIDNVIVESRSHD